MAGGRGRYRTDADGWTLRTADGSRAAHIEHTVAITDGRPRASSPCPDLFRRPAPGAAPR